MNNKININISGSNNKTINLPIEKFSHSIIFGSTGSGKSNLLHMFITNFAKKVNAFQKRKPRLPDSAWIKKYPLREYFSWNEM